MSFKKWVVGAFLTVLMVTALGANALLFSARSFQDNLHRLAPSTNGVLDLQQFLALEQSIEEASVGISDIRGAVIAQAQEASAFEARAAEAQAEAGRIVGMITAALSGYEAKLKITPSAAEGADEAAALQQRLRAVAASPALSQSEREQVGQLIASSLAIPTLRAEAEEFARKAETRRSESSETSRIVAEADRAVLGLKAQFMGENPIAYAAALSSGEADGFSVIRNEANALLNSSPLGVTAHLAQVHPQFLSVVLVLLMGLLGGVLYLFPAYMSRANPVTFAEIFVRMIFGMCTALAFYIVMNAAVAGFSLAPQPPSQGGAQTALNPFSVSLVGIIAGVLADDIARWIHRRGTELLGGRPGDPLPDSDPAAIDANAPLSGGGGAQGPGAAAGY